MDAEVRIVGPEELDHEAHARLQQSIFGPVLGENGIPIERLGADVFAWKFSPPAGGARTALAERDGELLCACSLIPVTLGAGTRRVRGWQVVDAATVPLARGAGLFRRCTQALFDSVGDGEWLFAFPNRNSRHTFERAGFMVAGPVPLWMRPIFGAGRAVPEAERVERFGPEQDELAERLAAPGHLTALRSAAYMRWRYLEHPFFGYECWQLRREGRADGVLVVQRSEARGRPSMWVMELLGVDAASVRALAQHARFLARSQRCGVLLSMANARLPGAWRLPRLFLPKRHDLMVKGFGSAASAGPGQWDVQTGDWDAF